MRRCFISGATAPSNILCSWFSQFSTYIRASAVNAVFCNAGERQALRRLNSSTRAATSPSKAPPCTAATHSPYVAGQENLPAASAGDRPPARQRVRRSAPSSSPAATLHVSAAALSPVVVPMCDQLPARQRACHGVPANSSPAATPPASAPNLSPNAKQALHARRVCPEPASPPAALRRSFASFRGMAPRPGTPPLRSSVTLVNLAAPGSAPPAAGRSRTDGDSPVTAGCLGNFDASLVAAGQLRDKIASPPLPASAAPKSDTAQAALGRASAARNFMRGVSAVDEAGAPGVEGATGADSRGVSISGTEGPGDCSSQERAACWTPVLGGPLGGPSVAGPGGPPSLALADSNAEDAGLLGSHALSPTLNPSLTPRLAGRRSPAVWPPPPRRVRAPRLIPDRKLCVFVHS